MDPIDYRDKIISSVAETACNKLTKKVVRKLQRMTEEVLSGDDSGLKNIWDEVCVQVRGEHSIYWNLYLDTIETIILKELDKLDKITQQAIWLQTIEGRNWAEENEEYQAYLNSQDEQGNCNEKEIIPDVNYETSCYILNNYVLSAADDWTNKRIENYLERVYED